MIIYTDLNDKSVIFIRLKQVADDYGITLRYGVKDETGEQIDSINDGSYALFWFAKTNKRLTYMRVKESLKEIARGLQELENHRELIK